MSTSLADRAHLALAGAGRPNTRSKPASSCPWNHRNGLADNLPLEEYPGTMLLRLAQAVQQEIASTYARSEGLSVTEWRILARLNSEGPLPLSTICRGLALDKPYVSRILRSLTPRDLVTVEKDPSHGRRVIVCITPAGRDIAKRLLPMMHDTQQQLLSFLSPHEREVLYGAVKKLQAAIPACRDRIADTLRISSSKGP